MSFKINLAILTTGTLVGFIRIGKDFHHAYASE